MSIRKYRAAAEPPSWSVAFVRASASQIEELKRKKKKKEFLSYARQKNRRPTVFF